MYRNICIVRLLVEVQTVITFVNGGRFWYYLKLYVIAYGLWPNLQSYVSWCKGCVCVVNTTLEVKPGDLGCLFR